MTRHETLFRTEIARKKMVLATDLDGTFLGGTEDERRNLYDWIETRRHEVGLVFVTGRDPRFIRDLTNGTAVPRPDFVVGDVGTTIAEIAPDGEVVPIPDLEKPIAAAWGQAGERVRSALHGRSGLRLQPTNFRYRVSYDLDPGALDPDACAIVEDMGFDVLISDNRFFDVLPRGVSKGPSLRRLLTWLGIEEGRCLVAGDTLNDLSMLQTGLPAVAVGGSEDALLELVRELPSVHAAEAVGAAGIREAIRHFDLHPDA